MHHHIGSATFVAAHHQNHLCPSWPFAMALGHHMEQGASTCCLSSLIITTHRSNSSRETRLVPFKKSLGASLVRHEEPWVCWENIKPNDWLNATQAPSFLMPSSATHNAYNKQSSWIYTTWLFTDAKKIWIPIPGWSSISGFWLLK